MRVAVLSVVARVQTAIAGGESYEPLSWLHLRVIGNRGNDINLIGCHDLIVKDLIDDVCIIGLNYELVPVLQVVDVPEVVSVGTTVASSSKVSDLSRELGVVVPPSVTVIEDTWTNVNWERLATANPDVIALVEYPGQSYQEKIDALKSHPATKDLTAVKEERFVNLPYAMWTESPLNIDAAEYLRKAFEKHGLAPASDVSTHLEMPADLPGRDKLS